MGITTDKQKIVLALIKLCNLAFKYISDYFNKLLTDEHLGFWSVFEKKLNNIYRQKDNIVVAKVKLEAL